jgi:hypothetical protein
MNARQLVAMSVVLGLIIPTGLLAQVRIVRCEGGWFGRYKHCAVRHDGRVDLVREFSNRRCRQWDTWGFDRAGIWVDDGCRAEFRVGREGGIGAGGAAIIGGIAGAAILGAILANRGSGQRDEAAPAPDWARGRFEGFSPALNADFSIRVRSDGTVSGTSNGSAMTGQVTRNNGLQLGDVRFNISRESWGFTARQRDNNDNVIFFRRR